MAVFPDLERGAYRITLGSCAATMLERDYILRGKPIDDNTKWVEDPCL